MNFEALKDALQDFISVNSGIPGNRVIWELQGKPRPPSGEDFITLQTSGLPSSNIDYLNLPKAGSPSDQATTEGIDDFTLFVRIFTDDFDIVGRKIQRAFRSREKCLTALKKRQLVNITIGEIPAGASSWEWSIEGVPFKQEYISTPTESEVIQDITDTINDSEWIGKIKAEANLDDPKYIQVKSSAANNFIYETDDDKLTMVLIQEAVDCAFRWDFGVITIPDEIRTDYNGTGKLDVVLSTHTRTIEEMEYIETVVVQGNKGSFEVDIS